jgi:hypothetical protein
MMRHRQPSFKPGEQVWIFISSDEPPFFIRASVVAGVGSRHYSDRTIIVDHEDGRRSVEPVSSCHRDSVEFDAWRDAIATHAETLKELRARCEAEGVPTCGHAASTMPEGMALVQANIVLSARKEAAYRVHHYGRRNSVSALNTIRRIRRIAP